MSTVGQRALPATPTRTGAHPVGGRRDRARREVGRAVGSAPLTFAYALVLLGTTAVLRLAPERVTDELLASSSTDVAHLGLDPVTVLGVSAGWLPARLWLPYALVLIMVVAPLERRIGAARTAIVFLSAHVLATLLTELPVAVAIARGWEASPAAHRLDVGASYGTLALVAAFVGGLPLRQALMVLVPAVVLVTGVPHGTPDMSMYGHALSLVIGACWWPTLYGRVPRRRPATPPV